MSVIDIGTQNNCSEATIRIDLRGQDKKKIKALMKVLIHQFSFDYSDDKEFMWSEGTVSKKTVFGIPCLEISGDAPYNFNEEITNLITKYLPNAKIEED